MADESPRGLAGLLAVGLGVCCGLPILLGAGLSVAAGLALGSSLVVIAGLLAGGLWFARRTRTDELATHAD